jgi:hypothetical protein
LIIWRGQNIVQVCSWCVIRKTAAHKKQQGQLAEISATGDDFDNQIAIAILAGDDLFDNVQ